MSRYIDADKLTFSRVRIIHSDGTAGGWNAVVMSSVINNAPTADVVEVVRCKDCKNLGVCGTNLFYLKDPNSFCSYGERK